VFPACCLLLQPLPLLLNWCSLSLHCTVAQHILAHVPTPSHFRCCVRRFGLVMLCYRVLSCTALCWCCYVLCCATTLCGCVHCAMCCALCRVLCNALCNVLCAVLCAVLCCVLRSMLVTS
jgi:hypothetical protein